MSHGRSRISRALCPGWVWLVGKPEFAGQQADDFTQGSEELAVSYASRSRLRVFYQVWDEPLYTLNRDHIISGLIADCGGVNIFADTAALSPAVSLESVIARDPEVICGGQFRQYDSRLGGALAELAIRYRCAFGTSSCDQCRSYRQNGTASARGYAGALSCN